MKFLTDRSSETGTRWERKGNFNRGFFPFQAEL